MANDYWQGRRVRLRALESKDIDFFVMLEDEVSRNVDMLNFPKTRQSMINWLEGQQRSFGDSFRWMAESIEGATIGSIETFACNRRHGTFKYGITVADTFRGNGYAKDMIILVLKYYFYELGYQKVIPHVYSFNTSSIRLHEGMGFTKEGQLRNMIYTDGQYYDEIYYGMTRNEFDSLYGSLVEHRRR